MHGKSPNTYVGIRRVSAQPTRSKREINLSLLAICRSLPAFRFKGKDRDLSKITPPDIARFMQHLTSRGKPFRDKTPPTHLRNFFQFLFKCGKDERQPRSERPAHRP